MANEVWEAIQRSEAEANQILEAAKRKSSEILKQARDGAAIFAKQAEDAANIAGELLLQDVSLRSEAWKNEQINCVQDRVSDMLTQGEQKLNGAVAIIIEKVVS